MSKDGHNGKILIVEDLERQKETEKIQYTDEKTELRCINCKKKLKKRIYSNGKVSYVCEKCGG